MPALPDFNYIPTKTGIAFHDSDAYVKLIVGPYGSGKTCMIMNDAKYYCLSQRPASDGVRYTRIGVVRGTYPELLSTTRKSILEVFPAQFGSIRSGGSPITGLYRFPVGDGPYDYLETGEPWKPGYGTIANVEFVLQALQDANDALKIRSASWTFAIINEATSIDYAVLTAVMGRIGRYPSEELGGCSYAGLLIDTNQPPQGHFAYDMIHDPADNWDIFKQPPAAFKLEDEYGRPYYEVNRNAENLRNLGAARKPDDYDTWPEEKKEQFLIDKGVQYYQNQITAELKDHRDDVVDNMYCMLDVPMRDGKPVFTLFSRELHVASHELKPEAYRTTIVGYDTSGIHPACTFWQEQDGKWAITDELYGEGMGLEAFVDQLFIPLVTARYHSNDIIISCDPANAKDSYTGLSPSKHLEDRGFVVFMPKTNDPKTRIRAVDTLLNRNAGGLIISPNCHLAITAMNGGYRYKRLRVLGSVEAIYDPKPEKNMYSHIADSIQYGALCIIRKGSEQDQRTRRTVEALHRRRNILRRVV